MDSELIPIKLNKIMQSPSYTVFILGTEAKQFAIYTSPHIGKQIQLQLTNQIKPRPYTHDLINQIFNGLDIELLHMVINDVQDTLYFARLFLRQKRGQKSHIMEIDARPSDCLSLALEKNVPIFCTKEVLKLVVPIEKN